VQRRYQIDPTHPLFRPIDSDDGAGNSYATLLDHALFKVGIPLHPNVSLVDAPGERTITVWRGVPSIANIQLTAPYLQDGRAATLPEQALGAIRGHMQPTRKPTARELQALEVFQGEFFYPLRIRALTDPTDPLPRPPGFSMPAVSPAAMRGKASFNLHCSRCHSGELANKPRDPSLIPTELTIEPPAGVVVAEIVYPEPIDLKQAGVITTGVSFLVYALVATPWLMLTIR
jgi:hypothetical protein